MKFLFILLVFSGFFLLGQEQNNAVNSLYQAKVDLISEQKRILELENKVSILEKRMNQSKIELNKLKKSQKKILDQSNYLESEIKTSSKKLEGGMNSLEQVINSKIYWVLGILILLVLLGSYFYRILTGRIHYLKDQIVKELDQQTQQLAKESVIIKSSDHTNDHTLAIRIANEVNRIERTISLLDPETRGLKQIKFSLSKLKDGLNANGYTVEDLVGKDFLDEMNYKVIEIDESTQFKKGQTIITRVLVPSVHHGNNRIQVAEIKITRGLA